MSIIKFDDFIAEAEEPKVRKKCKNFASGHCKYGDKCKFLHSPGGHDVKRNNGKGISSDMPHISQSFVRASDLTQEMGSLTLSSTKDATVDDQSPKPKFKLVLKPKNSANNLSEHNTPSKPSVQDQSQPRPSSTKSTKSTKNTPITENFRKNGRKQTPVLVKDNERISSGRLFDNPESAKSKGYQPDDKSTERYSSSPRPNNRRTPRKNGNGNGNYNGSSSKKRNFYAPHWSREAIQVGLKENSIVEGILRINKKNRQDGYVRREGGDENDIFIPGVKNQNRALEGDIVVVKLLVGEELEREQEIEAEKKKNRSQQNQERQAKINFFEELEEEYEFEETRVFGTVVGILEGHTRDQIHVGTLHLDRPNLSEEESSKEVGRLIWFKPVDKRVPFVLIPSQLVPSEVLKVKNQWSNNLYTAKITNWEDTSVFPIGTFTGHLGQMGELATESEALLAAAGITWEAFSNEVLDSLVPTPWQIPESEFESRMDLREERIFSIDPPTARDLDDAVSCKPIGDDKFELGVHIADVSFFVRPGTPLDAEALNRATSVYLVQKVIPMLPRLLCEELCSLNAGVDRLAFSVFWTIDKDANIIGEPRFSRTIINSCAKLWYDHAQAVIEGRDWNLVSPVELSGKWTEEQVHGDIKILYALSKKLRERRYANGALSLNSIKLWFTTDEVGNPIDSGVYEQKEANRLIEEFMLLANMAVAKKISIAYPESSLLRRHPPPLVKALDEVVEQLAKEGIKLDVSSAGSLQSSLDAIEDPQKQMLSRLLLIKGMKRAEYFCSGSVDISTFSHYALSVPLYTHFTSPIRRYCDVVVHRTLDSCLRLEAEPFSTDAINAASKQCNVRKFASRDAQDASQNLFLVAYLSKLQESSPDGILAEAWVNGVGSRAFDVLVPKFGIQSRVWLEDSMDLGQVAGVEADAEKGKLKVHWNISPREDDLEKVERTVGLDPNRHRTQIIGMFDNLEVLIVANMKQSPPSYKLFAVAPK